MEFGNSVILLYVVRYMSTFEATYLSLNIAYFKDLHTLRIPIVNQHLLDFFKVTQNIR